MELSNPSRTSWPTSLGNQERWGGFLGWGATSKAECFKRPYEDFRTEETLLRKPMLDFVNFFCPDTRSDSSMASSDLNHFLAIPWCKKLLNDPDILFIHNHEKFWDSGKIRGLFAEHVSNIKDGVKAELAFYPRTSQHEGRSRARFPELSVMLDLGSGVSGWPGMGHGGFISHLFDVVAGQLAACNIDNLPGDVLPFTVTAKLEVNYRKPVLIDRVLILKTFVKGMEGRKMEIGLELVDESGVVLCDGMALFLLANGTRL